MKKIFLTAAALLIVTNLLLTTVANAEIKTYMGVGEYIVINDETIDFAKNRAELIAERDALEQVKLYVKSNSRVINSKLLEDEIIVIAAGILRVTDTKFSIEDDATALTVKSFVTAQIDTDELDALLEREIQERIPTK